MKIVYCLIQTYKGGGTSRVICAKASYLADVYGYDVTIITTDQRNRPAYFDVSPKIKQIDLGINYETLDTYSTAKRLFFQLKKRKAHKRKLSEILMNEKADIVISTYTHEFTILPQIKDGSKKIGEIHFPQDHNKIETGNTGALKKYFTYISHDILKHRSVKKYNRFVVLTKSDIEAWNKYSNVMQIYNPISFSTEECANYKSLRVIAVGNLLYNKGFDRLIQAWAVVSRHNSDWTLHIYGDGEERERLQMLIKDKALKDSVILQNPTKNIVEEYMNSSFYVMSSRYEGFGMVLAEAMACGLPCVSFDCPSGPSEIITDGVDGFLVEDGNIGQLAEKIKVLMSNQDLRKQMGEEARKNIQRFSPEKIMPQWDDLFKTVLEE